MKKRAKQFDSQFSEFIAQAESVKAPAKPKVKTTRSKRVEAFQPSLGLL